MPTAEPLVALQFPGQGSQRPGMGVPWRDTPQWRLVEQAEELTGVPLGALLVDAGPEELRPTDVAQLTTCLVSLMCWDALRAGSGAELAPAVVAGHSLGEYPALVAAGAVSGRAAVRLVAERGAAMAAACAANPGTMAAVLGAPDEVVDRACGGDPPAWPANYNAPSHVVISGSPAGVAAAGDRARAGGARRVVPLPVGGAFHSPLMAPAQPRLQAALAATQWSPAVVPVLSNLDAEPHRDGFESRLAAALLAPVRWSTTLRGIAAAGATFVLELGPGGVLTGLARRVPGLSARTVATPQDVETVLYALRHPDDERR